MDEERWAFLSEGPLTLEKIDRLIDETLGHSRPSLIYFPPRGHQNPNVQVVLVPTRLTRRFAASHGDTDGIAVGERPERAR